MICGGECEQFGSRQSLRSIFLTEILAGICSTPQDQADGTETANTRLA